MNIEDMKHLLNLMESAENLSENSGGDLAQDIAKAVMDLFNSGRYDAKSDITVAIGQALQNKYPGEERMVNDMINDKNFINRVLTHMRELNSSEDGVTEGKAVTWTSGNKPDKEYMYAVHIDGEEEGTYHSLEQAKKVVANRKKTTPHRKYKIKRMKRTGAYTHESRELDEMRQLAGLNENYGVPGQPEQTGSMSISKQEGDVTVNISASGADMAELMAIMRKYGADDTQMDTPCGYDDLDQPEQPVDEIAPAIGAVAGGMARAGAGMAARSLGDTLRSKLGMNQDSDQE